MKFLYSDGPIIACSTGNQSHAAMAVLRISGLKSRSDFSPFFKLDLEGIEARKVYYTKIKDGDVVLDDVCLTFFEGPKSYNGENILELSIHGNLLNIERIQNLFVAKANCRIAAPGEFTYRALKNKKLTLSQVEGLDLFLNANTTYALDQGLSLLSGSLHDIYQDLYDLFLKHKAALELSIDFSDDIGEESARDYFCSTLDDFNTKFTSLVKRVQPLAHNLVQPEITLTGLPNSGKSSLFNFLLADERAIVSPIAGTTRDYLSEALFIEGVTYKLIDTAGLRSSLDQIEEEGIRRTKAKLKNSFYSILLINPLEIIEGFSDLLAHPFDLMVFTHADCPGFERARAHLVSQFPQLGSIGAINLTGLGRSWETELFSMINQKYLQLISDKPILLYRQKQLINDIKQILDNYVILAGYEKDVGILSHELNILGHCVSELLGIISPNQILDSIFSNFCIGK